MSRGWHYADVDAVRQRVGVGDQSDECANGVKGCPGPNADVGELPCFDCLLEARSKDDREVATDGGVEQSSSGTDHTITGRATVHHLGRFNDPEELPDSDKPDLMAFSDSHHVAHIGYECTCGERFLFGRTAAEHLRTVRTGTEQSEGSR